MANTGNLKSIHSDCPVAAVFMNKSERHVDVYWIDFKGGLVIYYKEVAPGKSRNMYTYATHPWVAVDSVTGQKMLMNDQPVYPVPVPDPQNYDEDEAPLRILIHLPVFRLEEICIGFFRKNFDVKMMSNLEVSSSLKKKLLNVEKPTARVYQRT